MIEKVFRKISIVILLTVLTLLSTNITYGAITKNTPFVEAKNGKFYIRDDEFRFVGTNNYYLHYKDKLMIDAVLDDAKEAGFNVIRMWGFLDGDSNSITENKAYMQPEQGVFSKPSWAEHDFVSGWDQMDYAISEAAKRDIRLIIVFTNYWDDFGGISEYVNWYNEKYGYTRFHPNYLHKKDFYTNEEVKSYYKNYVSYLLNRTNQFNGRKYIEDPTIFSWELMNEPRNPKLEGGKIEDVTNWADEMSRFVKSIDPNHMVALGDEGSFDKRADWDYMKQAQHIYDGSEGVDFEKVLALEKIDFGTFHLYPESWGINHSHMEWGRKFIIDHINVGKTLNKPVVLEEFGISANLGRNRELIYTDWLTAVYENGGAGVMFWMYASLDTSDNAVDGGYYPDYDGFRLAEIPGKYKELDVLKDFAKRFSGVEVPFVEKIHVISPYTTTGYIQIESDLYENQMYPIHVIVDTKRDVKKVEMYLDGELYTTLKFNKDTNRYETNFNMRHIYRGSNVFLEFKAYVGSNVILSEAIEINRLLKFDYFVNENYDFNTQYGGNDVQLVYYGAYNADFLSSTWSNKNGGMIKVSANHNRDHFWSEVKLEVMNLNKQLLVSSYGVSYDVYYEKSKLVEGILKPTDEAYDTAPGFRHYAALDPGWMKIGLNEHNIKYFNVEEVTIDGVVYLKQHIMIRYNANSNHTKLVLGLVTNHLLYDGDIYIDNLSFYGRKLSGDALAPDDYIDWYLEREEQNRKDRQKKLITTISIVGGSIVVLVVPAVIFIIKKKKQ
ncbi:cellulase family glycosylhydrolase [Acholeplasma hippikon]|uniref:mannan endo-1,4-beta-mannosidase n=1 Tax=Acholeplasma hippikon TaxID=264636 RepID=A0A449BLK6_9MOLU|nr:cellulase family glycosylhydrolase [Acholeplasma hippikon]VEU83309.1 Endo-beta-mannanase [Acholeplasma hippikon]